MRTKIKELQELQDYYNNTDNTYVKNKLAILETEIECEIIRVKIEMLNKQLNK